MVEYKLAIYYTIYQSSDASCPMQNASLACVFCFFFIKSMFHNIIFPAIILSLLLHHFRFRIIYLYISHNGEPSGCMRSLLFHSHFVHSALSF